MLYLLLGIVFDLSFVSLAHLDLKAGSIEVNLVGEFCKSVNSWCCYIRVILKCERHYKMQMNVLLYVIRITRSEKLERVQKQAARFITGDRTREEGCVTGMLQSLELSSLENRRSSNRLIFMYKVVEGLVPAIPRNEFLKPTRQKTTSESETF